MTFKRPRKDDTSQIADINANTGIRTDDAASCWFQNSYLYTNGRQRVGEYVKSGTYYYELCVNGIYASAGDTVRTNAKKHNRSYIGSDFDIPNHWFKFTGCKMESTIGSSDYYFFENYNTVINSDAPDNERPMPAKSQYGEYWDNCLYFTNTIQDVFYLNCINDLPGGITIRNSYLENAELEHRYQPPFRIGCNQLDISSECNKNICPTYSDSCIFSACGKSYPWIRFENNYYAFKFSIYWFEKDWRQYVKKNNTMSIEQFANLTCSYSSNCYTVNDKKNHIIMSNLMAE